MREILFRGKRIDNGEWVEGNLIKSKYHCYIITQEDLEYSCVTSSHGSMDLNLVSKDTVGQFTGLSDKNGKKIFEGDIVEVNHGEKGKAKGVVIYTENERGHCGFIVDLNKIRWTTLCNDYAAPFLPKVIGNIHDNPELLEGVCKQ